MGIREWTNKHKGVSYSVVSCCVLAGLGSVAATVLGNRHKIHTETPQQYFSVDDGKTFFEASGANIPPFDYEGKVAVRASVFECNGKKFVGYLERYKPDARLIEIANKETASTESYGRELKRPGDIKWVTASEKAPIAKIVDVPAPQGMSGEVDPVEP